MVLMVMMRMMRMKLDVMKEVAEKISNEDRSFMIGHPQCNTHSAHMKRENHLVVSKLFA